MSVCVSVVVPTHRRPDLLDRCLAALVDQEMDPAEYEVIVVDDGGCDESRRVVERWAVRAAVPVRYLKTPPGKGPAAARNAGWRAARGRVIAFTDDDCVPHRDWLRAGSACVSNGVAGAWGRTLVPLPPVPTDYELDASKLSQAQFVTANCFYKRDAIEEVGGFDERFAMAWREDSDLHYRVEQVGELAMAPDAVVVHPIRPAPWGISVRQQRKSMYNALLYKKHPEKYRQRIQPSPPWRYYGILAALLVMGASLASGRRMLGVAACGVWALLTGHFAAERLRGTSRAPGHVAEMLVTSVLIPPLSVFWRLRGAERFRVFFL